MVDHDSYGSTGASEISTTHPLLRAQNQNRALRKGWGTLSVERDREKKAWGTRPRTRCQETLLRAWRYRDSVKEGAPLRPWLYRVATNPCLESIFVVWFQASSETFQ